MLKNIKYFLKSNNYQQHFTFKLLVILAANSIVTFTFTTLVAQDLHFTQYTNAPLLCNPANTGFAPDFDYRAGINHRTQWAALGNPYISNSVWADAQLLKDKYENSWIGIGACFLNDVAGTGSLAATKGYLNVAYHQLLSNNSLLSVGFGGGFVQKNIDFTKFTFNTQWNGKFFDITLDNKETFITNNASYFDLNAGINYAWFASDNLYINGGASMMHFNKPSETFFSPSNVDVRLQPRYNLFVNANIKLNDYWIINPNIYYSQMANVNEFVFGTTANYNISGNGKQQLILGGIFRINDAAAPIVGIVTNDLQIMFTYDATLSNLTLSNSRVGAYEISLVYNGLYGKTQPGLKNVKCSSPKF
jgi:type IX secretion system PorP/SprF family membrane protein